MDSVDVVVSSFEEGEGDVMNTERASLNWMEIWSLSEPFAGLLRIQSGNIDCKELRRAHRNHREWITSNAISSSCCDKRHWWMSSSVWPC